MSARDEREQTVTERVVASFEQAPSERVREVMQALVHALHGLAREVQLTEAEWQTAIGFLTRCGQRTDDRRQEVILLSDVLGLSMLTVAINAVDDRRVTEATLLGPFFTADSPHVAVGGDVAEEANGQPCWAQGQVTDVQGKPLTGVRLDVWEADEDGLYDLQHGQNGSFGRGHLFTDGDGRYAFWCVRPAPYPIPDDGPVGELLRAAGRGPMRPAHVHLMVSAPGYRTLVTHVFPAGDPYLGADAVFGEKDSLVVQLQEQPPGIGPGGRELATNWSRFDFDIVLAPQPRNPHWEEEPS